jgi:predicted ArsR family transcriptional regulator
MTTKTKVADSQAKPRETKKAQLVRLLKAKAGSDAETLSKTLGWQTHTTRAAITGLKKDGFEIASEKPAAGGATRYRITAVPKQQDAPTSAGAASPSTAVESVHAG